jgi:4-hydroxy-tetrahydrodipicolinate synthase
MNLELLNGVYTALVTPFNERGVDIDALKQLTERQIDAGIAGIVPCGSTGEAATMSQGERLDVIKAVVEVAHGRVPVIAGTGSNNTHESVMFSKMAAKFGADAIMAVAPYYNKPTQNGMRHHFAAIANSVKIPLVLYNVPGRTASSISNDTVADLAKFENIIAIKDATGTTDNVVTMASTLDNFVVMSGDDCMFLPMLSVGARGLISVVSNLIPAEMVAIYNAWNEGKTEEAKELFFKAWPVMKSMFFETNPIPVKAALGLAGLIDPRARLPLTPMEPENLEKLKNVMTTAGLLP